jgi:Na+/Pi-cotransporter
MFVLSIVGLFLCMGFMAAKISKLLLGTRSKVIRKATSLNGYLAILVGMGTVLVQSSAIGLLTPLVGLDVITSESMFPLTMGSNLGTTITAIMAALVQFNQKSLQVALAHLFFNITGIVIWYPIPLTRAIPLKMARHCGAATRFWRGCSLNRIGQLRRLDILPMQIRRWLGKNKVVFTAATRLAEFMKNLQGNVIMLQSDVDSLKGNMTNVLTHCGLAELDKNEETTGLLVLVADEKHDTDDFDDEKERPAVPFDSLKFV